MAVTQLLTLEHNRDLEGWRERAWRPIGVVLLVALAVAGLLTVFGQRPDLVRAGITQTDLSVTGLLLAAGTIALLTAAFSSGSRRFPRARPSVDGDPIMLVPAGVSIERSLRRVRIRRAEIASDLRLQEIDSLSAVRWAVPDPNGKIGFIPKTA